MPCFRTKAFVSDARGLSADDFDEVITTYSLM